MRPSTKSSSMAAHCDFKVRGEFARATAAIIKRKHPDAEVMLRNLETGEVTVIDQAELGQATMSRPGGGARYEIAIDGTPRTY